MFGQPSLRRRLILSYLAVVVAVTAAGFVTVQVLVPQFFEQAVQQRLGPGTQDGQDQQQGQPDDSIPAPGPGQEQGQGSGQGQSGTTTTSPPDNPEDPTTTTTNTPDRTGSTQGPGGPAGDEEDPGNNGNGGEQGDNPDAGATGRATTTTVDAAGTLLPAVLTPGILAAGPLAQTVEHSPVPIEIREDYDRALTGALLVATAIGLVIALGLGFLFTRRLLRTFNQIKEGASLLADGHYSTRVSVPKDSPTLPSRSIPWRTRCSRQSKHGLVLFPT